MSGRTRIIVAVAAIAACTIGAGTAPARPRLTGEAELADMLKGRVAGQPVSCISLPMVGSSQIVDRTAIVYDSGSVRYVNRPRSGAEQLNSNDVMVIELHGSQLCSVDVVKLHDRTGHFMTGWVGLGEFVPYRRAPKA